MKRFNSHETGFTLIEMLVSIALFAIVMVVCVGALLSLVVANKKAQALESVMNNLNISLDDMVRSIRAGSTFNCGSTAVPNLGVTAADCTAGDTTFSFTPFGKDATVQNQRTVYRYISNCPTPSGGTVGCIERSLDGGADYDSLTAPEVSISAMEFYVVGTLAGSAGDHTQPRVIITISGTAGAGNVKTSTTFHLQATAMQRALDI